MHYHPSRRAFRELHRLGESVPVAVCLPLEARAADLFEAVGFSSPSVLLESAREHPVTGRFSLIVGDPTQILIAKGQRIQLQSGSSTRQTSGQPMEILQRELDLHRALRPAGFPPFVGGAVGAFGFDLACTLEPFTLRAEDDLGLPDLIVPFFDQAIVLDHLLRKLWVIALAPAAGDPDSAYDEAVGRVDALTRRVIRCPKGERSPSSPPPPPSAVLSTHTRASFEAMVRRAKEFIAEGQIYQANLSQRFSMPLAEDPWILYRRLSQINPSGFAAFADFGQLKMVSASPERFLRVQGRRVETRPIAGTRPRGKSAVETARLRQELILNEKERAEHLMLVDLERNDLGRVCRYGSVRVDESMVLEEYSHVIHIVSNVRGNLRPEVRIKDLIAAAFPGGTITGCPKIRSIEIIDELEPVRRGFYTGSLGYLSCSGEMDLNLLIRTAFVLNDSVIAQAGAGIVADSDPGREYEETLHKAQALMEALHAESPTSCELIPS